MVRCVGAVVLDRSGRLLVILRGHTPSEGLWSVPGGRVEAGESDAAALTREVLEETGLVVTCGRLIGSVRRGAYDIHDYAASVTGGVLRAGSDAAGARWVTPAELRALPVTPGLVEALTEWGVLSPSLGDE